MKNLLFAAGLLSAAFFAACESDRKEMTDEDAMLINMAPATGGASAAGTGGAITPVATPSGTTPSPTAPATQAAKTTAALNPPHGQPGHRCDIPEGAPLDSPPAQSANVSVTPAQNTAPAQTVAPAGNNGAQVAAGANPAHGEPGHRCDVPVGAPLNSPPAKTN